MARFFHNETQALDGTSFIEAIKRSQTNKTRPLQMIADECG